MSKSTQIPPQARSSPKLSMRKCSDLKTTKEDVTVNPNSTPGVKANASIITTLAFLFVGNGGSSFSQSFYVKLILGT